MRRLLLLAAISLALVSSVGIPHATSAPVEGDLTVTGEVECTVDKGDNPIYLIRWTVDNTVGSPVTIDSAELSGELTGSISFEPMDLAVDQVVTTISEVEVPAEGTVTLTITYTVDAVDPVASASVELDGTCGVETTTTTAAVSPATTAAAEAAAVTAPRFTG